MAVTNEQLVSEVKALLLQRKQLSLPVSKLTLKVAIEESIAWLKDERKPKINHKEALEVTFRDLSEAIKGLGTRLSEELKEFTTGIDDWILHPPSTKAERVEAVTTLESLTAALTSRRSIEMAYLDVIESCRKAWKYQQTELFAENLLEILEAGSITARNQSGLLQAVDILAGSAFATEQAKIRLGVRGEFKTDELPKLIGSASTSTLNWNERLELSRHFISFPPTKESHVVWFKLKSAVTNKPKYNFGDLKIFNNEWITQSIEGRTNLDSLPKEIISNIEYPPQNLFDSEKNSVLVRIELGPTYEHEIYERGKRILEVFLSAIGASSRAWTDTGNYLIFENTRNSLSVIHTDSEPEIMAGYDPVANKLDDLEDEEFAITKNLNPDLEVALEYERRLKQKHSQGVSDSILTCYDVINYVNTLVTSNDENWDKFLRKYVKPVWIKRSFGTYLNRAHFFLLRSLSKEKENTAVNEVVSRVFSSGNIKIISNLKSIAELSSEDPDHRFIRYVEKVFSSHSTALQALNYFDQDFERLLSRFKKLRDSLEHSGPRTTKYLESISGFSFECANISIEEVVDSFSTGDRPSTMFNHSSAELEGLQKKIREQDDASVLFPNNI